VIGAIRTTRDERRDTRYQIRDARGVPRERRNTVIQRRICAARRAGFRQERATPFCAGVVTSKEFLLLSGQGVTPVLGREAENSWSKTCNSLQG